jgi:hypothetical protein
VRSEFRTRLLAGAAAERLLERLRGPCQAMGPVKARGRQRTDATHVLTSVRVLNRLELPGESLRAAPNEPAAVARQWLRDPAPASWHRRPVEDGRLPRKGAEREASATTVGRDGCLLLEWQEAPRAPGGPREANYPGASPGLIPAANPVEASEAASDRPPGGPILPSLRRIGDGWELARSVGNAAEPRSRTTSHHTVNLDRVHS